VAFEFEFIDEIEDDADGDFVVVLALPTAAAAFDLSRISG